MITEQDLLEAIAECQGERSPNANTCIKLSAFYILLDHLYPKPTEAESIEPALTYSRASADDVGYITATGDSEFMQIVSGMRQDKAFAVLDDLMNTVAVINPRLYDGVIRELTSQ